MPDANTPPASDAEKPAPAGKNGKSCTCKRPSFRWIKVGTGLDAKSHLLCSFCNLGPDLPEDSKSPKVKEFLGTRCTNSKCQSERLRNENGRVICADCGACMLEAPEPGPTLVCPKCGRDNTFARRRNGAIYCRADNTDAVLMDPAKAEKIAGPKLVPSLAEPESEKPCPKCGAPARAIQLRGDGRAHCTSCDSILDLSVRPPTAPTLGQLLGHKECPNCKAPAKAIGRDGSGRAMCTSCDYILTDAADPESLAWAGDHCPSCGAPPNAILPDGNGRQHCTSCDRVLAERA